MAKETAHQLGTPLSSLMAWVELLKATARDPTAVNEMKKDVDRLEVITERFSKIGSAPDLVPGEALPHLARHRALPAPRLPGACAHRGGATGGCRPHRAPEPGALQLGAGEPDPQCRGRHGGRRAASPSRSMREAQCAHRCDGHRQRHPRLAADRTVFQPGFTTKKRGWGLGLSLSKRIIEQYHGGRIFVKRSAPGKGTTFRISLRKATGLPPSAGCRTSSIRFHLGNGPVCSCLQRSAAVYLPMPNTAHHHPWERPASRDGFFVRHVHLVKIQHAPPAHWPGMGGGGG
jgi:two-component system, sporulation sensor kinase D